MRTSLLTVADSVRFDTGLRWSSPRDRRRAELAAVLAEREMAQLDPQHYTMWPTLTDSFADAYLIAASLSGLAQGRLEP
jgi:hypothetical protein